jgi:hypothetical protein
MRDAASNPAVPTHGYFRTPRSFPHATRSNPQRREFFASSYDRAATSSRTATQTGCRNRLG